MKSLSRLLVFGVITGMIFIASAAQAAIRDAGAQARGEYGSQFDSNETRPTTTWTGQPQSAGRSSAGVASGYRSYSFDPATRRPDSTSGGQAAKQPSTATRRFSYEPKATATPLRSMDRGSAPNTSSNHSGGNRDAASKVLGQY